MKNISPSWALRLKRLFDVAVAAFVSHCSGPQTRSDEQARLLVRVFAVLMYCDSVQTASGEQTLSLDAVAMVDSYWDA